MRKEKRLLSETTSSRVYHVINTCFHWMEMECGFNGICKKCNYKETGICRAERIEMRSWKVHRKTQWKIKKR